MRDTGIALVIATGFGPSPITDPGRILNLPRFLWL